MSDLVDGPPTIARYLQLSRTPLAMAAWSKGYIVIIPSHLALWLCGFFPEGPFLPASVTPKPEASRPMPGLGTHSRTPNLSPCALTRKYRRGATSGRNIGTTRLLVVMFQGLHGWA